MSILTSSVVAVLVKTIPQLRSQIYFKSSLTALSHAMEDQVLAGSDRPLVIATFQRERFYLQEAHRYRRIAQKTPQVYVMAAAETEFKNSSEYHETVAFNLNDPLTKEWNLVVIGEQYSTCLACVERQDLASDLDVPEEIAMDQARPFEGIWTCDRAVCCRAAELLLQQILHYRPELQDKVKQAIDTYGLTQFKTPPTAAKPKSTRPTQNSAKTWSQLRDPFTQRLVTYLQAGQHKLLKVYRTLAAQERKERLVNSITAAMRQSLNHQEIIKVATLELGEAMQACRCLIYRCKSTQKSIKITEEFCRSEVESLVGQQWPLHKNPLFQAAIRRREGIYLSDLEPKTVNTTLPNLKPDAIKTLQKLAESRQVRGWLMVPVLYQGQVLGIVELHQCQSDHPSWRKDDLFLVNAIATQLGAALIQAETHANLEDLNQQLEALDRTRSNLIAITGHELRTPLSTIQVCLESLNQEPDMPSEMRQVMLETALDDAERMRKLVQDFLMLSHLESGRIDWNLEFLPLRECIDLAISGVQARYPQAEIPQIITQVSDNLPLVKADGEWLVQLLSKLLDNACKFTTSEGEVIIKAKPNGNQMLEVTVTDTGRGIEPNRLEAVFDRFYQEEGSLRRTVGGTGLGLAISKQIVRGWGGNIWADSAGKNQGSVFHFTIPFVDYETKIQSQPAVR
ncbi:MAG: DICT sensory domain-containing protein [Microcoleaceae cyanobacterium]